MISKTQWIWMNLDRQLWFRSLVFATTSVLAALFAGWAQRFAWIPTHDISADTLGSILNVLATSMLTVATFSLGILVASYSSAQSSVTPRATVLMRQDKTSQNAIGVFLGVFLFSLVGIIALGTNFYNETGRMILFIFTLITIAFTVITLLRWMDHMSGLGLMEDTAALVENATRAPLMERAKTPALGGVVLARPTPPPEGAYPLKANRSGYLQHIDMDRLSDLAEQNGWTVRISDPPGAFLYRHHPLAWIVSETNKAPDNEQTKAVHGCFKIMDYRTFDQDPRFGLSVLTEVASRALSPAVNDPGTAIDVIGRAVRLLSDYADFCSGDDCEEANQKPIYPRLSLVALQADDLFDDVFPAIARDGASLISVQIRLQKGLNVLAQIGDEDFQAAARKYALDALRRAEHGLAMEGDKQALRNIVATTMAEENYAKRRTEKAELI